jgi:hypothetical protein
VAYEMCSPLLGGGGIDNLDTYARRFLDYVSAKATADTGGLGA